jgi:hypothetical protein
LATIDTLFFFAAVLSPLLLGAAPALVPRRISVSVRWIAASVLLAGSLWITYWMRHAPHAYHMLFVVPFWAGWLLGTAKLVAMLSDGVRTR